MAIGYSKFVELVSKYLPHPQALELNKWIDELRRENEKLRDEIKGLKERIGDLTSPNHTQPAGIPPCPNCSTAGRPFFMSPIPPDFVKIENATHECPRCHFKTKIK